jgi:HSP20 family protein
MSEVAVTKKPSTPATSRWSEALDPFPSRLLSMSPFAPFSVMRQLSEQMDQLLRGNGSEKSIMDWAPTVDVQSCNGTLVASAELPGLKKEEVKVEVTDDTITIEGERNREHKEDHEGYHRYERSYGRFFRSIPLPEGAKADQAKAELKDGLLKVTVPVAETAKKAKQVAITS